MKSNIKSFSVYGLFGTNDVHIPFDEDVKILIGENGIGKTQVLSMFYYTLCGRFEMLLKFPFEKLEITFLDGKVLNITKLEISILFEKYSSTVNLVEKLGVEKVLESKKMRYTPLNHYGLNYNPFQELPFTPTNEAETTSLFSSFILEQNALDFPLNIENLLTNFDKNKNILREKISEEITFLPTFRRIEFDLQNLGYDTKDIELNKKNILIQFGMSDVEERLDKMEDKVKNLLEESFGDITKDILKIVINNTPPTNESIFDKISEKDLEIIFARAGNGLEQELKDAVTETVKAKQFKNPFAGFLLQKLIEIYEKQKPLDNLIKAFRDVCNGYLINKKVFYDESAIKIYLKSDATNAEIELSKLSSGEKQIISIFSKIYLSEAEKRFIVLFDEPELSLSVFWQKKLLPDIMKSNKCNFLLAVTHSPFIFDNELDKYAIGLNEYIQPAKTKSQ